MYIYRGEDIKRVDEQAALQGLDTFTLMENAGRSLFEALKGILNKKQRIVILSGKGNNGGDGIVLARYLHMSEYNVELAFPLGIAATEIAKKHLQYYKAIGLNVSEISGNYDVIIDALLGVGAKPPLKEKLVDIVKWANSQDALRVAIDVPTGVMSNLGDVDLAFHADYTYSLHGFKPSAFLEESTNYYGKKQSLSIGIPHDSSWKIWTKADVKMSFLKRSANAHKGTFGTGLLVAGCDEMPGSAMLASLGAMRAGIGKLTVATSSFASSIIAGRVPECTYLHDGIQKIASGFVPKGIKAVAIGPGLEDEDLVDKALQTLFTTKLPIVLDAGALQKRMYPKRDAVTIVTPHPREFSRMTGKTVKDIQNNRMELAYHYSLENDVIVVLKGRNTVIAFPDGSLYVNETGNVGLAKGGTGDTLTGIILAFLSSYTDVKAAIANAVYFHGATADLWYENKAATSMLASDISDHLAIVMKEFE